jgi:hypothetical protein
MIAILSIVLWSALFIIGSYISWKKIVSHIKVYLFIFYNFIFLTGVFLLSFLLNA